MRLLNAATVTRLPQYYQILKALDARGRAYVSSEHIAGLLKIDPSLVRKDMQSIVSGVPKVGYHIAATLSKIEQILGVASSKEALLVGAGSLGRALLGYVGFQQYGLRILAAFDTDEAKCGQTLSGIGVHPMDKFESLAARLKIRLGIIAVPEPAAQAVADRMVAAGIIAIWNFAPVTLSVPDSVLVRNENLAAGFALLSYQLDKVLQGTPVEGFRAAPSQTVEPESPLHELETADSDPATQPPTIKPESEQQ